MASTSNASSKKASIKRLRPLLLSFSSSKKNKSGGRTPTNELLMTFPDGSLDAEIDDDQHRRLLEYLFEVTDSKEAKFTVVIDRRLQGWSSIKDLIRRIFEVFPKGQLIENVFVLRPTGFLNSLQRFRYEWSTSGDVHNKVKILGSVDELYRVINPLQLSSDLGGQFYYNNDEWFKHCQLVELLHHSCMQLTQDLEACGLRMHSIQSSKMTAGQLKTEIQNLEQEQQQMDLRTEKMLSEAGAEIAQLKTINGETLPSAELPPLSVHHVKSVESLIGKVNDGKSNYYKEYEKCKASLARSLILRQFEEENNKWCAILDEHLLFLENFTSIGDSADEVRKYSEELVQFDEKAKADFCKSYEFYKNWQSFLSDGSDITSELVGDDKSDDDDEPIPVHDNRLETSYIRYQEFMSFYHEKIELCGQLHSHIEQATNWYKRGQELLSKSIPESKAKKSVLEKAAADVDVFLLSVNLQYLTNHNYTDVMTVLTKDVVHGLVSSLEAVVSECNAKREQLKETISNCSKKAQKDKEAALATSTPPAPTVAETTATKPTISVTTEVLATSATPGDTNTTTSVSEADDLSLPYNIDKLYLSSKMNQEFSKLKPVTATGTIRRKRGHVIQELVATERIYTTELQSIIEGYLQQFDNPELQSIPDDLRQKRSVLFGNIEDIYSFHSNVFLKCLENCEPTEVGKCFTDHKTKFEMYGIYCQNKMQAEDVIERMGNYPFLVECQKRLGHRLPLSSYILKPIQRITKYHLLLRELIKMTTSQKEKDDLCDAVESMRDVVKYVNNILHQVSITGFDGNLSDQGRLLMQGSVEVWWGKRRDKKGDARLKAHRRHVFLYEKCILFCKKKEDSQMNERGVYTYKNCLKTDDIGLTETPKGGDERRFELWCQGRTDVWTIIAPNEDIKDEWIKEIKRLLYRQYRHIRDASRLSQIGRQGSPDSAELKQLSMTQT